MSLIRRIYRRIANTSLVKFILPVKNLLYEATHKNFTILTASVIPMSHNWGDDMSLQLCMLINPNRKYIINRYTWNLFRHEDVLSIGSIITWMTTQNSIIWGSGIVYPDRELSAKPKRVLAVRGPLSRQYLLNRGIECPEIYGDPALLFPRYYNPNSKKTYRLGIIPHFRDKKNKLVERFAQETSIKIIDVENIHPWHQFIDDICSCDYIASSSLHGIIISDAYGIPNIWVEFSGGESKRFAFQDYYQSVGRSGQVPLIIQDNKTSIEEIIDSIEWEPIKINTDNLISVCPFLDIHKDII